MGIPSERVIGPGIGDTAAGWRVTGAAVRGSSHEKNDLPCQDALGWRLLPDGALIVALADGAGSAAHADLGAQAAVEAALEALAGMLADAPDERDEEYAGWDAVLLEAFFVARQALVDLAETEGVPLRELSATLTCVIASEDGLAVAQLGDGAVVAGEPGGPLFAATQAQRGEYANETYFLTQADALEHVQTGVYEGPLRALAVMSDGLLRLALKLPGHEPHTPFFQPLFAFAAGVTDSDQAGEQLAAFLSSERVCARTDDDKALVLAVWRPAQLEE